MFHDPQVLYPISERLRIHGGEERDPATDLRRLHQAHDLLQERNQRNAGTDPLQELDVRYLRQQLPRVAGYVLPDATTAE